MPKDFMYLTAIIDIYSRFTASWSTSNSMEAEWINSAVKDAVDAYGKPIINFDHRRDQLMFIS